MSNVENVSLDEARAWIEAYGRAWIARDPEAIIAIFSDDGQYREHRFKGAPLVGREAIRSYWEYIVRLLQRDVQFTVEHVMVSGNVAFCHWTSHFTWIPINDIMEYDGIARVTFLPESRGGIRLASVFEEWTDYREI